MATAHLPWLLEEEAKKKKININCFVYMHSAGENTYMDSHDTSFGILTVDIQKSKQQ